jgi:hypothetical protein
VTLSDASFIWEGIVGKSVIAVLVVLPSFVDRGIYFITWRVDIQLSAGFFLGVSFCSSRIGQVTCAFLFWVRIRVLIVPSPFTKILTNSFFDSYLLSKGNQD